MTRTLRTLLLSTTTFGALATVAPAAPPTPPPSDGTTAGMASMHATGTMQMHTGDMTAMNATMTADPAVHEEMLNNPTMQAHMAEYGVDTDPMRRWHEALAAQDIEVDAMQADCPMLTDASMAAMHRNGDHDPSSQHRAAGR